MASNYARRAQQQCELIYIGLVLQNSRRKITVQQITDHEMVQQEMVCAIHSLSLFCWGCVSQMAKNVA